MGLGNDQDKNQFVLSQLPGKRKPDRHSLSLSDVEAVANCRCLQKQPFISARALAFIPKIPLRLVIIRPSLLALFLTPSFSLTLTLQSPQSVEMFTEQSRLDPLSPSKQEPPSSTSCFRCLGFIRCQGNTLPTP